MLAIRLFLGFSALIWFPYGIFCFLQPGYLTEAAGLGLTSATATTEVRAMYGGLQMAIGALSGMALLRPTLVQAALTALAFLAVGLGTARLIGSLLDASYSTYTVGGLIFEFLSAGLAIWLLRRSGSVVHAPAH